MQWPYTRSLVFYKKTIKTLLIGCQQISDKVFLFVHKNFSEMATIGFYLNEVLLGG